MADDITEVPQPASQEDNGTQDLPYREYLERVPEQYRGEVQPVLDDWNKHVNSRFEQHADYRKQFEPYEQAGITNVPPEELQGWLQFRQAAMENPQAIQEWYEQYAAQNGLTVQQQQQLEEQGFADPDLEQLLEAKLSPLAQQYQELAQWRQQLDQAVAQQNEQQQREQQFAELAEKHGESFNRPLVEKLLANYQGDPQAVSKAFHEAQELVGSIEKQLVANKLNQPAPAESGGGTSAQADLPSNLKEASKLALEQLRGMNAA